MTPQEGELNEPLLADSPDEEQAVEEPSPDPETAPESDNNNEDDSFSVTTELYEMLSLGFPLAVSFFCRMGMASTDSAFVGHIQDDEHSAATYLAAAVLSDMVLSVCITPPLAFNQVLNALVAQAMGSGNPQMAGIWLQQSCFWLTITLLPCLVGFWYVQPILLALGFPDDIAHVAGIYARYNVVWPIPNGLYQCMRFYFQAQGLPRPAMYNNVLFLFVNAGLNWLLVFGGPLEWQGLGFIGAALSLSASRTLQGVVYYLYMFQYRKAHLPTFPTNTNWWQEHTTARTCEFLKQAVPNIGTLLFQVLSSQATTVLVGRLGELSIAASSALQTVSIPWSGTLGATGSTISSVRVGYHLGRGNAVAARISTWLVLYVLTGIVAVVAVVFLCLQDSILQVATNDSEVVALGRRLVVAMLIGTYLNLIVSNLTSGVFGGMGRPLIATILSFGFELPMSIGGVAIYILYLHGNLLGVYWWSAISGALELVVVLWILLRSDWGYWAVEAQRRQEAAGREEEQDTASAAENPLEEPLMAGQEDEEEPPEQEEEEEETGETVQPRIVSV